MRFHSRALLLIIGLGCGLGGARAGVFTVGGFTFDEALAPTSASVVQGPVETDHSAFVPGAGFDVNKGTGDMIRAFYGDTTVRRQPRHAILGQDGSSSVQDIIELTWGGTRISNGVAADDFVIYENGNVGKPEPFGVAIKVGGLWSQYRYEFADTYTATPAAVPGWTIKVFATGFDMQSYNAGGFVVGSGAQLEAIRIMNLVTADGVTSNTGQGFVRKRTGNVSPGIFSPKTGPLGSTTFFGPGQYDADITYVAGLSTLVGANGRTPTTNPEPGTMALLAGGAGVLAWRRRRAR